MCSRHKYSVSILYISKYNVSDLYICEKHMRNTSRSDGGRRSTCPIMANPHWIVSGIVRINLYGKNNTGDTPWSIYLCLECVQKGQKCEIYMF